MGISEKNKCTENRLKQLDKGIEQAERQHERGDMPPLQQNLDLLIEEATGARALNSKMRRQEVIANWKEARK